MDKEYTRFINGEINYFKSGDFSIGRERISGKNVDYYVVKVGDEIIKEWFGTLGVMPKGKTMGGKKPYIMLMQDKLTWLMHEGKITAEQVGYMALLSPNIEWGTGKLIHKRSKKPLQSKDIQEILNISHNTWDRKVKELKKNELMTVTKDGYFISTELFKKGGTK